MNSAGNQGNSWEFSGDHGIPQNSQELCSMPARFRSNSGVSGRLLRKLALVAFSAMATLLSRRAVECRSRIKNPPTCYKAPKWPDREFPRKIPKTSLKLWNPKKTPRKHPENTPKIPKKYQKCAFFVFGEYFLLFSGYFRGRFWESRISGRGVFFWYFSWKFRVGPSQGSVAGQGGSQLKKL